jgi:hypothetical protein
VSLILSRVGRGFALQLADRLVSRSTSLPFDRQSNKMILFSAADGVFSLAYSGAGFVRGINTDAWIASLLTGRDPGHPEVLNGMRNQRLLEWLDIGTAVNRLRDGFEAHAAPGQPLSVSIAGFRGKGRILLPLFWYVGNDDGGGRFQVFDRTDRYWGLPVAFLKSGEHRTFRAFLTSAEWRWRYPYRLFVDPGNGLGGARFRELHASLQDQPPDVVEEKLTYFLRETANESGFAIGKDCTSVLIPANAQVVRIRYLPFLTAEEPHPSEAYYPWVIGPLGTMAPMRMAPGSGFNVELGPLKVQLESPEPGPGRGGFWWGGTQPRHQLPGRPPNRDPALSRISPFSNEPPG